MLLTELFITLLHTEHQSASQTEHYELGNLLFHLKRKVSTAVGYRLLWEKIICTMLNVVTFCSFSL
jgi:hypothetical protein